jgi:hypothetical protein
VDDCKNNLTTKRGGRLEEESHQGEGRKTKRIISSKREEDETKN